MDDINTFYYNDYGIAFQWKRCAAKNLKKIQLVFRSTGLLLSTEELITFSNNIEKSLKLTPKCTNCEHTKSCKSILLEAPNPQTSFALSFNELENIKDLVQGTLFQLGLNNLLSEKNVRYI